MNNIWFLLLVVDAVAAISLAGPYSDNYVNQYYTLGVAGQSCTYTCWAQGYKGCITNVGDSTAVMESFKSLVPAGNPAPQAGWENDYHPYVKNDLLYGWENIPKASTSGDCESYPPNYDEQRLCLCSDSCEDTFRFCPVLRVVCEKYPYTSASCQNTCNVCTPVPENFNLIP